MCPDEMEGIFSRTEAVIGKEALNHLSCCRVAVFGLGGVGAACAEALVRGGVGNVAIIDHDIIKPSNLNRQLIALHSTLGQAKTEALRHRLLDINPDAKITAYPLFYNNDTQGMIDLAAFDAAADCVDTLASKLLLAKKSAGLALYLLSCMGTGNRLDPGRLRIADIYQTSVCPLARRMRKACRDAEIPALRVLYSDEEPIQAIAGSENGRHIPGSVSFVPPVAGMIMAGSIIQYLVRCCQDSQRIAQEPS